MLHPEAETASLLRAEPVPPLGRFADQEAWFATRAAQAEADGTGVDQVWVACKYATPTWMARTGWLERWGCKHYCNNIIHIEMVFRNSPTSTMVAYTIDKPDPTRPECGRVRAILPDPRETYPAPNWSRHLLSSLTPAERYGLMAFMERQIDKPFNANMYTNFLPVLGPLFAGESVVEEERYFCSHLVACALRWIRPAQYADIEPRRCSPAQLQAVLSAERSTHMVLFRPVDTLEL